jgi:hypothetical protein
MAMRRFTRRTKCVLESKTRTGLLSRSVLLVAHLFHPVHYLSIELLLNGDMRHGCGQRGPVPVLFAGWKPNHIPGADLLDRAAFALGPTAPSSDDQRLTERVRMPRSPRARLEGNACTLNKCRIWRLEKRIDPYRAGEPI